MTASTFLLVISRIGPTGDLTAGAVGSAVGRLTLWVAALRRWQLLLAAATDPEPDAGSVRGCLLVAATDLAAARALAFSCPLGAHATITVLPVRPPLPRFLCHYPLSL